MKNKITYEIILSDKIEDFVKILHSKPKDYKDIDLTELIRRARELGKKEIKAIRIDFFPKDIKLLRNLGVYDDLDMGSTWLYSLFLDKEGFEKNEKRKKEHLIESLSSFRKSGWI